MKKILMATAVALVCGATFAQSNATKAEIVPQPTSKAGMAAEAKVEARKAGMNHQGGGAMVAMDANGDGMISQKEYNAYHGTMWKRMKYTRGMVTQAEMDRVLKGGPN